MRTVRLTGGGGFVLVLLCSVVITSCTHVYKVPVDPERFAPGSKFDLKVELLISEQFRATEVRYSRQGDTFVTALGEALATNAENLAKSVFSEVVVDRGAVKAVRSDVDAVLTPRVVSIEQTLSRWAFGDSTILLVLEWLLEDRNGNVIWVETVTGEGVDVGGNLFTMKRHSLRRGSRLIQDLFAKSFDAFSTSAELARFAANTRRAPAWKP